MWAVVLLGALAVWAAIVSQNGADELSRAGVQTSGHLRAIQALSALDADADTLEDKIGPREVQTLRESQRVFDDALQRMETGGVPEASRIADQTLPVVARLKPAVDQFLATRSDENDRANRAEEELEELLTELQVLLNDLGADPSALMASKLEAVTATERTVRVTAFALIPFGLGAVAACGWMLTMSRRRSEAAMRSALDRSAEEARTDELTGLPNRRALLEELEHRTDAGEHFKLILADLNGFKRYNDNFGHPAGDALLRRLGRKLATVCEGRGIAARLGGDEFCVLFFQATPVHEAHALLAEALSDSGEGFHITASSGVAAVPEEAQNASAALRLADSRMYAAKVSAHPSAEESMSLALNRMLDERHPGLGSHVADVADLAAATAEQLGLPADVVQTVERTAELHDIGKVGLPGVILTKQDSLDDEEWEFMRRHTLIGERILTGVPSVERVAPLVRSAHERWDGQGYPDRLAGEAIPLGSRIVHVADAYCAMTETRPYARARTIQSARQELRKCSGAQFDPSVVSALLDVLDGRPRADARTSPTLALTS